MSERVRIKVCGLTRPEDVLAAVRLGVDFLGFVFVPHHARGLHVQAAAWLPELDTGQASRVGVFQDQPATVVNDVARRLRLDFVQLDGHEPRDYPRALDVPCIVARRTPPATDAIVPLAPNVYAALVDVDAHAGNAAPARREPADRQVLAAGLPPQTRVFLSGALTDENVARLADAHRPFGVDVGAGVESAPGIKDVAKLRAFCAALGRRV